MLLQLTQSQRLPEGIAMETIDAGLLLVRVAVGLLLIGHGSQKAFGWFGGPGLRGMAGYLEQMGYRPALLFAVLAGIGEVGGGLLLVFGLATPLGAALVVATMINAYAAHAGKGVWAQNGGWEYLLVLGVAAAALSLAGPGAWSLDAAFGLAPWADGWALGGVAVGLIAGVGTLLLRGLLRPAAQAPKHADA
jgi:putative oxidoreductase